MCSKQDKTFSHKPLLIAFHMAFTVGFSESLFRREERKEGEVLCFPGWLFWEDFLPFLTWRTSSSLMPRIQEQMAPAASTGAISRFSTPTPWNWNFSSTEMWIHWDVNGRTPSEVWHSPSQLHPTDQGQILPAPALLWQHRELQVKQATRGYSGILLAARATKEIQAQHFNECPDALSAALATESPG